MPQDGSDCVGYDVVSQQMLWRQHADAPISIPTNTNQQGTTNSDSIARYLTIVFGVFDTCENAVCCMQA